MALMLDYRDMASKATTALRAPSITCTVAVKIMQVTRLPKGKRTNLGSKQKAICDHSAPVSVNPV